MKTKQTDHVIRLHSRLARSCANGPGTRAVLWMQGCHLLCPGCFNPSLKDTKSGTVIPVSEIVRWLLSIENITGISISGGEPTEQVQALLSLLNQLRNKTNLSILLFSGRTFAQIVSMQGGSKLVSLLDVLVDGPFDSNQVHSSGAWPSSANQKIHLLSDRYAVTDFSQLPAMEVMITEKGEVIQTGMWGPHPIGDD